MPPKGVVEPIAEGVIVQVAPAEPSDAKALAIAQTVARRAIPGEWTVRALGDHSRDYLLTRTSGRPVALGRAFDLARELRADRDVASAEPALVTPGLEPDPAHEEELVGQGRRLADLGGDSDLDCSKDRDWSLKKARVREGWAIAGAKGAGIVVGHPDTGYTRHYEIWSAKPAENRLLIDRGYDFVDRDGDGEDRLKSSWVPLAANPGHGTGTASVIMAVEGPVAGKVSLSGGVAPKASLVPLRVTEGVVLLHYDNLAEALHYAGDNGYHVVSISLGGPTSVDYLERAIEYAIERGVIVLAAAGNVWPFVVWPAHYDQVVAVAASNCQDKPWPKSAHGPAVDITAPGDSVWRASPRKPGPGDDGVSTGHGTSFAVAMTAGACALWLAHHGRAALIKKYGDPRHLAPVFKEVLMSAGYRRPAGWKTNEYGTGILDVEALLKAPLPDTPPAAGFRLLRSAGPTSPTGLEDILALFPGASPTTVRRGLARVLNTDQAHLGRVLADHRSEIRLHLSIDPGLRAKVLAPAGGRSLAVAAPDSPAPRLMASASRGLLRQLED